MEANLKDYMGTADVAASKSEPGPDVSDALRAAWASGAKEVLIPAGFYQLDVSSLSPSR